VKIGTLNCRSLATPSSPHIRRQFITYLRHQHLDILAIQESHAFNPEIIDTLNQEFGCDNTIWSKHCGLICFNPNISIKPIYITIDQRVILIRVIHEQNKFSPFLLANIYAPVSRAQRYSFHTNICNLEPFCSQIYNPDFSMIILGDFNY
ncbi:hypothetical protein K501DRAFT_149054, partial [Backusella circina FSU 941]